MTGPTCFSRVETALVRASQFDSRAYINPPGYPQFEATKIKHQLPSLKNPSTKSRKRNFPGSLKTMPFLGVSQQRFRGPFRAKTPQTRSSARLGFALAPRPPPATPGAPAPRSGKGLAPPKPRSKRNRIASLGVFHGLASRGIQHNPGTPAEAATMQYSVIEHAGVSSTYLTGFGHHLPWSWWVL